MMLHLIYGLSGTGKTAYMIDKIKTDIENGKKVFLIVPEQQTVEVERTMTALLPPSAQLDFEVVNFTRLANKLFRIYGGLSYRYINKGMKQLFMWQTLKTLAPLLKEYGNNAANDLTLPSTMLSAIGEMKNCDISPIRLEQVASALPDEKALKNKLSDLSLIYSAYEGMVSESYDDNSDDIAKLAQLLLDHSFFGGYHIYIDSFIDFTAQEFKVIKCILAQAEEVYISLLAKDPDTKDMFLSSVTNTAQRLLMTSNGNAETVILNDFHRFTSPSLEKIARDLWHFHVINQKDEEDRDDGAVSLIHCTDVYEEAKATVSAVLSLVRERGYRFREIAVIAGNADSYRGILDVEFEKAGIPFFMSEKTDITAKPLFAMIFAALAIKTKNYRATDVMAYVRSGLSEFTPYEADMLESYVSTWQIHGKGFTNGEWTMNPDGYTENVSERGKAVLQAANEAREKLIGKLEPFFEELDKATCLSDYCNALYCFLKQNDIAELLKKHAARALEQGDKKEAAETAVIFKTMFSLLSDMTAALGDQPMSLEEFSMALRIVLLNTEIGTIPTAADQIMVGSASMLRAANIRSAVLLGVCEGEFPMRTNEKGLFSDTDRTQLEEMGISLSGKTAENAADELLHTYRAITTPSERLVLIYRDKQISGGASGPSIAIRRICELIPSLSVTNYETLSPKDRIHDKATAFEMLPTIRHCADYPSLFHLLSETSEYKNRMGILDASVTQAKCQLEPGTASMLFGDHMSLTQSKIEKYVSCHFSYYCRYVLKLRETGRAQFDYSNIGTFIHKILEVFVKETGKDTIDVDSDIPKIKQIIRREIEAQSKLFIPKGKESEGRILHLLLRFYRLASLVAVNICREQKYSKFVSKLYEAEFGTNSKHGLEAPKFTLGDGSVVSFGGKVDRIDTYRKDGKMYIRVVDYKTGAKTFSLDDIREGYSVQLLLYLFAICDTKSEHFKKLIGCENGDVLSPAGAIYLSMAIPKLTRKTTDTEQDTLDAASKEIKRSGVVLNNSDTLLAMNEQMDPQFLAGVRVSAKNGALTGKALTDEQGFSMLKTELWQTVCRIAEQMRSGNADAAPDTHAGVLACTYCEMKPFCRVDKLKASDKKTKEEETL
jgi:ATP-dependent helicase/nuclease subunit B